MGVEVKIFLSCGKQEFRKSRKNNWIPAFAGMAGDEQMTGERK
jgi:hypothetical protein